MTALERDARDGSLERTDGGRRRLRLVRALAEERPLAAWFRTTIEGGLRAGAPLRFRFRGADLPPITGELIACDPPRLIAFTWGSSGDDGGRPDPMRFDLTPRGGDCPFAPTTTYDQVGKSARDAAGWHACLDLLEAELAGGPAPESGPARWRALNRLYPERSGPEASTIGPPEPLPEYHDPSE